MERNIWVKLHHPRSKDVEVMGLKWDIWHNYGMVPCHYGTCAIHHVVMLRHYEKAYVVKLHDPRSKDVEVMGLK